MAYDDELLRDEEEEDLGGAPLNIDKEEEEGVLPDEEDEEDNLGAFGMHEVDEGEHL